MDKINTIKTNMNIIKTIKKIVTFPPQSEI